jgi:futalosine hydrolase
MAARGPRTPSQMGCFMDVLIVVATHLEAQRLPKLPDARVVVSGIGSVNAALAAQAAILESRPRLALSLGIAGAYPNSGLNIGDVCVSSEMVFAGLGAMDGAAFLNLEAMGFPLFERGDERVYNALKADPRAELFAASTGAKLGPILTLETVTGSLEMALALESRVPGALAEGMEGAGVALAASRLGVGCLEIRGISNMVGPRDRSGWRIPLALEALGHTLEQGWSVLQD